jgi:hypothetical protein
MKKAIIISILSIMTFVAHAQLTNLDFENWYDDSTGIKKLNGWEHFYSGLFGTWRVADAQNGAYALKLSRWYYYTSDWVMQRAPNSIKYKKLNGYYKYIDNKINGGNASMDSAIVSVFLTRSNTATSITDTIGQGQVFLSQSNTYQLFSCPIYYNDTALTDSITIIITPMDAHVSGICPDSGWCSFLTIDNLSHETPVAVEPLIAQPLQFYPNPASNLLFVKTVGNILQTGKLQVIITDMLGRMVLNKPVPLPASPIDLTAIKPGNYFIIFKHDGKIIQAGKIVKA